MWHLKQTKNNGVFKYIFLQIGPEFTDFEFELIYFTWFFIFTLVNIKKTQHQNTIKKKINTINYEKTKTIEHGLVLVSSFI